MNTETKPTLCTECVKVSTTEGRPNYVRVLEQQLAELDTEIKSLRKSLGITPTEYKHLVEIWKQAEQVGWEPHQIGEYWEIRHREAVEAQYARSLTPDERNED